jgi:hypothetical protein
MSLEKRQVPKLGQGNSQDEAIVPEDEKCSKNDGDLLEGHR